MSPTSGGPKPLPNVLLIDDNPANLMSLRVLLEGINANLVEATSGEAALELVERQDFAVILLDVFMPGMSGFRTAELFRRHDRAQHSPIIFLTAANLDQQDLEEGYRLGAVDFLVKPLSQVVLQAKVRGFIELFEVQRDAKHEAQQLRLLVQGTTDYAIFMLTPRGHVATWNSGAARLKGYTAEEIIGEHFSRFYTAESNDRGWPQHELRVAEREGRFEDEGWRVRKDGTLFWANVVITALRDEHGHLSGFGKVTRDLTARKQAEEALRQSEERFRLLIEGVRDYAIFWLDPQGRVASWNPGAEQIKQYRAQEIIGRHFSCFYLQDAIDRGWPDHELELAQAQGHFEDEGWRLRKDGTRFWANVVITAIRDSYGALLGYSKITRDITERKAAEENARLLAEESTARRVAEEHAHLIQEQRERLRVTLASIGDAVISTDAEGKIAFLNRVAENLLGWNSSEATGQLLTDVFHIINETSRLRVENPAMVALREGKIVGMSNRTVLIGRDGSERPIDDSAAPIRNSDGETIGSVLVFRDVGPLKLANEALERADRRKDEFLATLAHELRNPLAPIRNALQVLKMARVDAETLKQTRDVMDRQVQQLVRLVDDLLDVSRVMRGKISLRKERVELAVIVARAVEMATPFIEANGHQLNISLPNDSLAVDGDTVRLVQVVGNLLTNAAKYSEPNGRIYVTAQACDGNVALRVRDEGIGIAPDTLPHIFELFVQADHSTTRSQGGLGIGLTLVKSLVEMHGGSVEARSGGLGNGSEFVARLPLATPVLQESMDRTSRCEPSRKSSGHRVLIVDDNRDAATTLAMLLRLDGHDVHVAYDGRTALNLVKQIHPDAALLDIGMPDIDGYEVARRIRAAPEFKGIKLVALTGWGQAEDRRRSAEAGFDHHLVKPPEIGEIQRVLEKLAPSLSSPTR